MNKRYKPEQYNSVAPYFVVDGAQKMVDFLSQIFGAQVTRRYDNPDGSILHAELRIDDSMIMLADSTADYLANQLLVHVYVPDVDAVFQKALDAGCQSVQAPKVAEGDPDRRGMFTDFSGNTWAVATQQNS